MLVNEVFLGQGILSSMLVAKIFFSKIDFNFIYASIFFLPIAGSSYSFIIGINLKGRLIFSAIR